MTTENPTTLDNLTATRHTVEILYQHHLLSSAAREYALELLYPPKNWGLWAARLLLTIGVSLILSGIVYFFAFNWYKLTPFIKFTAIEVSIGLCLIASYFYGLQKLGGKILLLSASVLIGVFLAVFGQIYQTGADSYELFKAWALLTAIWVIISQHLALWTVWAVIINTFTILYWQQVMSPMRSVDFSIFAYLIVINGSFLVAKEYLAQRGLIWLKPRWARLLLVIFLLGCSATPIMIAILDSHYQNTALGISMMLGIIIHLIFMIIYRYQLPDMGVLAMTLLSIVLLIEVAAFRILVTDLHNSVDALIGLFLAMTVLTIIVFAIAVRILRYLTQELENRHD